jgi:hypothetical protein
MKIRKIKLTQNKFSLVDEDDFNDLNKFKWHALFDGYNYYAGRSSEYINGKRKTIKMHTVIMNTPKGMEVDHIDGDGLNNTKKNLRICTHSQNSKNQGLRKNNTSGFKGVYQDKIYKKWIAKINIDGKRIHLGRFNTKEESYEKYCQACKKYHKKYFKLF